MNKITKKNTTYKKKLFKNTYNKKDYNNEQGMLTSIWGPGLWHFLHVMSFNYPVKPSLSQKKYYKQFIYNLQHILPCKYCRINLSNNFKKFPLKNEIFENRYSFSRYIYNLHEVVNKLLNKNSNLSYCQVRDRYENFRSRCTIQDKDKTIFNYKKFKKEKGCTTPLYGKKAKCVINIVPQEKKCKTLKIDKKCLKRK
jgi:hypothetical protein|tara:strand:- start:6311 stop:6901 length:591 start_codon:yes stop_codon:yes gene_type:complete